ncbi:diguanylate cyclase [Geovibrio thiophilus]|uniref:diguanylate cyclase n=1 Tax=Geovibrio thiophilus TaxID=139438 RepID=A0A3R5UZP4_9BACT|nr:diguanylate cyclase response regulator [Geovibrio thiophilus]QAR32208.1 diguanylate cyclase [Geovibrio thiophilus]
MDKETHLNVLIVEDNPGDARLIEIMLHDSPQFDFRCKKTDRLSYALEILAAAHFDVILLDLALPDSFGLETFIKARESTPKTPIVVLTGNDDETIALSAVREGAQDYIVKGQFDEKQLVRAINYAIERQKTVLHLHKMSFKDELTGLNNRRGFMIKADELLKISRRGTGVFTIYFIDLDGMKHINDNLGHSEGDKALIDMADIMRKSFRESDITARLGGDEFAAAVILEEQTDAGTVRSRLGEKISRLNDSEIRSYKLSASIGWAFCNDKVSGLEELLNMADEVMYAEKKKRKNPVS